MTQWPPTGILPARETEAGARCSRAGCVGRCINDGVLAADPIFLANLEIERQDLQNDVGDYKISGRDRLAIPT